MDSLLFDDQHQPIPNWMEKLAETEFNESNSADDANDDVTEKKAAKYNGITSTWQRPGQIERSFDGKTSERSLKNKSARKASMDEIELSAKRLVFKHCSLDKIESELKKAFDDGSVNEFVKTRFASIEQEFGKLGYIYADANIAYETDCDDVRSFLASMGKVSSIAISKVKKSARCDGCSFNRSNNCLKLGMKIEENPGIKTAEEAKSVLNRFASLKYINSTFIKSAELITYYERLKTEDPQLVIKAFLDDIDNRRATAQTSDSRIAAKDDKRDVEQIAVIPKINFRLGAEDRDVENSLKESLLTDPDLKSAQKFAEDKFGADRVKAYMKEAKDVVDKYIKFLNRKARLQDSGYLVDNVDSQNEIMSKTSGDLLKKASDALHIALDNGVHITSAHKDLVHSFGADVAKLVIDKHALDINEHKLGHLYLTLSKKSNAEHVSTFNDQTRIDTHREAMRILNFAKKVEFADNRDINKVQAKLKQHGNANIIRSFLLTTKPKKKLAAERVDSILAIALKYASPDKRIEIRKYAGDSWANVSQLTNVLSDKVLIINKKAFKEEIENTIQKSANDANAMLTQANQCSVNVEDGKSDSFDFPLYNVF